MRGLACMYASTRSEQFSFPASMACAGRRLRLEHKPLTALQAPLASLTTLLLYKQETDMKRGMLAVGCSTTQARSTDVRSRPQLQTY